MKTMILFVGIIGSVLGSAVFSQAMDKLSFDGPKDPAYNITMVGKGLVMKPAAAYPNDTILIYWKKKGSFESFMSYRFIGRTSEKTFELETRTGVIGDKKEEPARMIKVYFDPMQELPLVFTPGRMTQVGTNCTDDDYIRLKMLKLQGNKLEYELVLPQCLRVGEEKPTR
jgi:hypothetical protein